MSKEINPILAENSPNLAEVIESLLRRYDRSFNLNKVQDQATLAEGMRELGEHVALNGKLAKLEIEHSSTGLTKVVLHCTN